MARTWIVLLLAGGCGAPVAGGDDQSVPADLAGADLAGADLAGADLAPPPPGCRDGLRNGGETDVDCGGPCPACADGKHCAAAADCASGTCCGGACASCTFAHATGECLMGACTIAKCDDGWGDCDGMLANGCEHDVSSDPKNCKACGRDCGTFANTVATICDQGGCNFMGCVPGFDDCDKQYLDGCEANLQNGDPFNCGACNTVCLNPPNTTGAACMNATCGYLACKPNFGDCDKVPASGCESNLLTDAGNCGKCGNACSAACRAGQCVNLSSVAAGGQHTCAKMVDGTAMCWGMGFGGELGYGNTVDMAHPIAVSNLTNVSALALGEFFTFALLGDATLRSWGRNDSGQLCDGNNMDTLTPVTVPNLAFVKSVSAGNEHGCASVMNGTAYCWGVGLFGRLGNNSQSNTNVPVQVSNLTNVAEVAAGAYHSCARKNDGTVWCWGDNTSGQLGDGTKNQSSVPVQVQNIATAVQIACSALHTCARLADKTLRCWGYNGDGELGDGTTTDRLVPVTVKFGNGNPVTALQLVAGSAHNCVLSDDNNGDVWCWGYNNKGQLGDGTTTNRSNAVNAWALATQVVVGDDHSCAMVADGTVYCWGDNSSGQLGDGTFMDRSKGVLVQW